MSGIYEIWKIERLFWLEPLADNLDKILPNAQFISHEPFYTIDLSTYPEEKISKGFVSSVKLHDKNYVATDQVLIISYKAIAKCTDSSGYTARCMTVYIKKDDVWKASLHQHSQLDIAT